jgi:hypothetical protein
MKRRVALPAAHKGGPDSASCIVHRAQDGHLDSRQLVVEADRTQAGVWKYTLDIPIGHLGNHGIGIGGACRGEDTDLLMRTTGHLVMAASRGRDVRSVSQGTVESIDVSVPGEGDEQVVMSLLLISCLKDRRML